jgi:NADH:ubiquinone oxidoreductase subunit 6 (subunit J)
MSSPVKELQDGIVLVVAAFLLITGVQIFLNKDERSKPASISKALSLMLFGLFLFGLWYSVMRVPSTGAAGAYRANNLYRSNYRTGGGYI